MTKGKYNTLTANQMKCFIIGAAVSSGILSLPNFLVEVAKQDGWISSILGGIYPFYMILICIYISNQFPNDNILTLSKRFLGKYLGSFLNLLFAINFIFYSAVPPSSISNFLRTYVLDFLSAPKFLLIFISIGAYTAYKGLYVLGKLSELAFYIILFIIIIPLFELNFGTLLNMQPVFQNGYKNILIGSINSLYSYGGIEIMFIVYPFIKNSAEFKNSSLKAAMLLCFIYSWATFTTIYILGIDFIPKTIWSSIFVVEKIKLPFLNNFRYIIMFLWTLVTLKSLAINYFACAFILKDTYRKIESKKIYLFIFLIIFFLSLCYGNEVIIKDLVRIIAPILVIFSVLYVSLISLIIFVKKGNAYEKK
ncbi:GerAB/ArcD/ProY family transporter [Clostridium aciditolerans]|uniref:GerAB/ArcD/ProY family transporter n=1 Tax=Clostridium aciditolerans TaxID=339861 RepID=A0A934M5R3_9CLOT|nr:GerAB/ArcD/ProY family transporter [Clostridium aciditolerans]MBI6875370.1 GerAB/ArcD/ProY family transporter [Clostridium aciditolerans]